LTNAKQCLLAHVCKFAADPAKCTQSCPHFVQLHGRSGLGGRVAAANLPREYRLITLENAPARAEQSKIYKRLDAYKTTFSRQFETDSEPIKSLYLWSESPGTGKTTSAAALLNEWMIVHYLGSLKRGRQALQRPAYFLDVNEFQTIYNEFNRDGIPHDVKEQASRTYYTQYHNAKTAPFAVLDDIGVRDATPGFRGDLHSIINHRVANGLVTVYTSNLPIVEMKRIFDERLYDRIRDLTIPLHFEGESKRGLRK
jgi:DNA replication protein DnaC